MKFKNLIGHLKTVIKHKWVVFKLCVKAGIPIRGIVHDLSKFSPTEFFESVKYYQGGKRSPIVGARNDKGYSEAWLHHAGRNKHHLQYWYDIDVDKPIVMPYKYSVEMICDKLAAGIVYQGENWTKEFEINYWNEKESNKKYVHPKINNFVTEVCTEVSKKGIDEVITKKNLRKLYDKYCR